LLSFELLLTSPHLKFHPCSPPRRTPFSHLCYTNIADPSQSSENNVDPRSCSETLSRYALIFSCVSAPEAS